MKGILLLVLIALPLTVMAKEYDEKEYKKRVPMSDSVTKDEIMGWMNGQQRRSVQAAHKPTVKKKAAPTPATKARYLWVVATSPDIPLSDEAKAAIIMLSEKYQVTYDFHDRMCPMVEGKQESDIDAREISKLMQKFVRDHDENNRDLYRAVRQSLDKRDFQILDGAIQGLLSKQSAGPDMADALIGMEQSMKVQKFMWQNNCYTRNLDLNSETEWTKAS